MTKRERTAIALTLAFAGCAGAAAPLPPAPTPAPPPLAAAPSESASASPSEPSALVEDPASPAESLPPPAPTDARLTIEPSYAPSAFPWPRDAADRKALVEDLARWNAGGVAEGERWHAAPRVVIGEPIVAAGKTSAREAMRVLRREQYWAVRRCYEPRLREHPTLEGRTVLRLVVGGDGTVRSAAIDKGRVPDDRKHGRAMTDREVVDCLARSLRSIRLPAPRSKSATLRVAIDVWPGDAPLPAPPGAARGKLELPRLDAAIHEARAPITECFTRATRGAWGRLAMRVDVGADGHVDDVGEVESTFPDADVTACVATAVRAITLPAPSDGEARAIVAFRWSAR